MSLQVISLLLAASTISLQARQSFNINGRVTNHVGVPQAGAVIKLLHGGVSTTSDANGAYALKGEVAIASHDYINRHFRISYRPGEFTLQSQNPAHVSLKLHDLRGKMISIVYQGPLFPGRTAVPFALENYGQVFLLKLSLGEYSRFYKMVASGLHACNISPVISEPPFKGPLAKSASVDNLLAAKSGYRTWSKKIDSYRGRINIKMAPLVAKWTEDNTDYIYAQNRLRTYELLIHPDSLAYLDEQPAREDYVEGAIIFQGDTISPVGIRYKGSIGAWIGCKEGSPFSDEGRKMDQAKCSIKIKFNWDAKDNRFYGLRKLQFHSMNEDDSKMHERLGYYLFRAFGVYAPRSVHANLYINGNYAGLYALTEQIDKEFIDYNFNDNDGNLFKEMWPLTSDSGVTSADLFIWALKTNEAVADVSDFTDFAKAISSAADGELREIMQRRFDMDKSMRNIVVDRSIAADDGMYHWYCFSGNDCFNHNYYWYQESVSKKVHIIPWDLDHAFMNVNLDNKNHLFTWVQSEWNETRNDCRPFSGTGGAPPQRSGACDKLLGGFTLFENLYNQLKAQFFQELYNEATVNSLLDAWRDQIDTSVTKEGIEFYGDKNRNNYWKSALIELKEDIKSRF